MIDLRPIGRDEAAAALAVLDSGFREIWGLSAEEIRANHDSLEDLGDPAEYYSAHRGAFLVLVDEGRVIGTGGIAALGPEVAELKRVWVLPPYRGKGLGRRMAEGLLVLYRRLGFREIARYRDGACELSMERNL
jgi:GNAT superfamily N-acetyltransferase